MSDPERTDRALAGRIFVTGGCGVNGSWVVRELVLRGHDVTVFDHAADFSLLGDLRNDFEFVSGDIRDGTLVTRLVRERRPAAIVHLAALVGYPGGRIDPRLVMEVNAGGTANVLEAALAGGVARVVFTSSKAAYGVLPPPYAGPQYRPVPEDQTGQPFPASFLSMYSHAKIASEGLGLNYHQAFGIEFVALRFATICAPGKLARHGPLAMHSRLIENAMAGAPTKLAQGGEERDDIVYVKDVAQGIVRALAHREIRSGIYNIGQQQGFTLHDMADAIRSFVPSAVIDIGPGLDFMGLGFSVYSVLDITRARRDLGYAPQYDLKTMVEDYCAALGEFGIRPLAS